LDSAGTTLTGLFFRYGANFYVLTFQRNGHPSHILIDAGDTRYRNRLGSILSENGISVDRIEQIMITHSHHDHFGMADLLAGPSNAEILAHRNFRRLLDEPFPEYQRRWLKDFDLARLRSCRIAYLDPSESQTSASISGLDFPVLAAIPVGDAGILEILACPESQAMHTTDQLVARYSSRKSWSQTPGRDSNGRPGDDILFSGDLWLMHGPLFAKGFRHAMTHFRFAYHRLKLRLSGKPMIRRDPRIQDAGVKDALKQGFSLIRVMPGHGDEFLGTRIIPKSFLARRDLLVALGYSMDEDLSKLKSSECRNRVSEFQERAYEAFLNEIALWKAFEYTPAEITECMIRIYREQAGGGKLVQADRKERRKRIRETLARMKADPSVPGELRSIGESALSGLKRIR